MVCQDDGSALTFQRSGVMACGLCRGRLLTRAALETIEPNWKQRLTPDPTAKRKARSCPRCHQAMSNRRIDRVPVWLDWCAACECVWLEEPDEQLLRQLNRRAASLEKNFQPPAANGHTPSDGPGWLELFFADTDISDVWDLVIGLLSLFDD